MEARNLRYKKMNNKTYKITDREAGNKIESGLTLEDAKRMVLEFEQEDKKNGEYTPNFYLITETDAMENVSV